MSTAEPEPSADQPTDQTEDVNQTVWQDTWPAISYSLGDKGYDIELNPASTHDLMIDMGIAEAAIPTLGIVIGDRFELATNASKRYRNVGLDVEADGAFLKDKRVLEDSCSGEIEMKYFSSEYTEYMTQVLVHELQHYKDSLSDSIIQRMSIFFSSVESVSGSVLFGVTALIINGLEHNTTGGVILQLANSAMIGFSASLLGGYVGAKIGYRIDPGENRARIAQKDWSLIDAYYDKLFAQSIA